MVSPDTFVSVDTRVAPDEARSTDRAPHRKQRGARTLDLSAATLTLQRPGAEVFAVVRQEPIAAFAQPRAGACHDFAVIEAWRVMSNPDAAAMSEVRHRNFLHRSAPQPVREAAVVDDASVADVDAMVAVESAWGDEVRREWRLLGRAKNGIAREEVLIAAPDVACIVGPPVHGRRRYARSRSAAIARWSIDTKGSGPGSWRALGCASRASEWRPRGCNCFRIPVSPAGSRSH